MIHRVVLRWLGSALLVLSVGLAAAQAPGASGAALRDPTLPPAGLGIDAVTGDAQGGAPQGLAGASVVVREGKSFLLAGGRLVAPGQMVDQYKLERITETEIWLRDGSGLTKLPRFAGVQRSAAATRCPVAAAAPAAPAAAKSSAPGKSVQPTPRSKKPAPKRDNKDHDC